MSRVVFVRLRSLGDTVLMTPALTAAKRVPGMEVAVAVEKPFDQVLEGNPDVDRVIAARGKHIGSKLALIREIRNFGPELIVDLHGGTTSALMTLLSGASRRVGYAQSRNSRFYNIRVPNSFRVWQKETLHTVEHQLTPLKHLGFPVQPIPPLHFPLNPAALEVARETLRQYELEKGYVLIHPDAAFDTKRWDPWKFSRLGDRLVESGCQVAFIAGPGQEDLLLEVKKHCRRTSVFLRPVELPLFGALVSLCNLYIGNDTGTTHLAAALGKRIVVIFGSSDASVWYPWGVDFRLLKSERACVPCPGYTCLHYNEPRCIRSIHVDPVLEAARELLCLKT